MEADGSSISLDGGGAWEALLPLFRLRRQTIEDVTVGSDGRIQLRFVDGISLFVDPAQAYEKLGARPAG